MKLNGTYRGLAPTDESGVGVGELEFVFDDEQIRFRMATGLDIDSTEIDRSELRQMDDEELCKKLYVSSADLSGMTAFAIGDEGPIFVFLDNNEEPGTAGIAVFRLYGEDIDAIFGPSVLFTPEEVRAGHFDQAVQEIETAQGDPGVIPRLANGGLRLDPSAREL